MCSQVSEQARIHLTSSVVRVAKGAADGGEEDGLIMVKSYAKFCRRLTLNYAMQPLQKTETSGSDAPEYSSGIGVTGTVFLMPEVTGKAL